MFCFCLFVCFLLLLFIYFVVVVVLFVVFCVFFGGLLVGLIFSFFVVSLLLFFYSVYVLYSVKYIVIICFRTNSEWYFKLVTVLVKYKKI